jgi:hypothetical protein
MTSLLTAGRLYIVADEELLFNVDIYRVSIEFGKLYLFSNK